MNKFLKRWIVLLALFAYESAIADPNIYTKNAVSSGGSGTGTVTSVSFTGGLISVANPTTTPALTVAGTSGGVPYFSGATTWASSGALTANLPVIGGGAGSAPSVGTRSGNTTQFVTTTGTLTSGDCVKIDASGNFVANGSACGGTGITIGTTTITSGTSTRVLYDLGGVVQETPTLLINATAGQGPSIVGGTATTDVAALSLTRTNNNAAVATGVKFTFTDTTSAAGFLPFQILGGAAGTTNLFSVDKSGITNAPAFSLVAATPINAGTTSIQSRTSGRITFYGGTTGFFESASAYLGILSTAQYGFGASVGSIDTSIGSAGANQVAFGGAATGTSYAGIATSRAEINKAVTGIADATPTATFTVTIPNAAHSGMLQVTNTCSLGAGGAIGANEATATNSYNIAITRVAGVNAAASISSVYGGSATAVAGAATVTATAAVGAISGAVGASNTFTVDVTVTKSGGSSTNHTCLMYGKLMNANASGITIQ